MLPKISIVTPVFNRVHLIEDTILSVINQGYPNLEYIIVDGGSTDGTLEIIKKYEKYLALWVSEPDKGMYDAIQKGFDRSTGDIMAWVNSDDIYKTGSLAMIASVFTDLDVEWIIGMPSMYNSNGFCVKINDLKRWSKSKFWIGDYKWIQQENVFWKRSLWQKSGERINTDLRLAGDFDLWCRFLNYAYLHSVNTSFAGFRSHGSQLSVDFKKEYEGEAKKIVRNCKPKTPKETVQFWTLYSLNIFRIITLSTYVLRFLEPLLSATINKIHQFPRIIYYDFNELKWKK